MTAALIILALVAAAMLAWNFIPAVRVKLKGFTTVLEVILGTALYYFGVFGAAVADLQAGGAIPEGLDSWVPYIMAAYIVAKRLMTDTPLGRSKVDLDGLE